MHYGNSRRREKGIEIIFKGIIAKNLPYLKYMNLHIQESQQIPNKIKGSTLRHTVKLFNSRDNE